MNFAGKKNGWEVPGMGIALIFCLVSLTSPQNAGWFRFVVSFSFPLVYFINGYHIRLPKNMKAFGKAFMTDALQLLIPAVITVFLRAFLTFEFDATIPKTVVQLRGSMQDAWTALNYASGDRIGDTAGIGLVGILLGLFFSRLIASAVHILVVPFVRRAVSGTHDTRIDRRRIELAAFLAETAIMVVLAVISNLLFRQGVVFIPGISKAMESLWFFAAGRIYHKFRPSLDKKQFYFPLLGATIVFWIVCQVRRVYLNMNATSSNWTLLSIVSSICACYVITSGIRQLCRSQTITNLLSLWGEHVSVFAIASCLDALMPVWSSSYVALNCITRPLCILGYTMMFCMAADWLGVQRQETIRLCSIKYWKALTAVYLGVMAAGIFARAYWTTLIFRLDKIALVANMCRQVAIAGSLFIWGLSIPRIRKGWIVVYEYVFFAAGFVCAFLGIGTSLFPTVLVILGATGKSYRKITWTALLEILVMGITTYFLSMNGFLPYEVQAGGLTGMHTFGFSVANQAGWFFMMVCMLYLIVRSDKSIVTILYDISILLFSLFFVYRYTDSVTAIVGIVLLAVLDLAYRVLLIPARHFQSFYKVLHRGIMAVGLAAYPLMFLFSILIPLTYYWNGGAYLGRNLIQHFTDDSSFASRMANSMNALYNIPLSLFGNNFEMNTDSGAGSYFFVDSAYIYTLLRYGILLMALFMFGYIWLVYRCSRRGQDTIVLVLTVLAVYNFSENILTLYAYTPMLLFIFASLPNRRLPPAAGHRRHLRQERYK